jgi:hypothetical protein
MAGYQLYLARCPVVNAWLSTRLSTTFISATIVSVAFAFMASEYPDHLPATEPNRARTNFGRCR